MVKACSNCDLQAPGPVFCKATPFTCDGNLSEWEPTDEQRCAECLRETGMTTCVLPPRCKEECLRHFKEKKEK